MLDATATDDYQSVQAELESLCGVVEKPVGMYRDLAASFERVNREYFGSALARPRLTWSRTFTGRKFGHYDPIRDTVMISATLDREDLPEYALDFVVYHELLHKQLGINWRQGRMHAPYAGVSRCRAAFRAACRCRRRLESLGSRGLNNCLGAGGPSRGTRAAPEGDYDAHHRCHG